MFGKFFETSAIDSFANQVVADLRKAVPPERIDDGSKQTEKQRAQIDSLIRRRAVTLVSSARLNVYQKAKVGPLIEAALVHAGYPQDFGKAFAYEVVKLIAVASLPKN